MKSHIVILAVALSSCAPSVGLVRGGAPTAAKFTRYYDPAGQTAGFNIPVDDPMVRTRADAAGLSKRVLNFDLGRHTAHGTISFDSAQRSTQTEFYEQGVMELFLVTNERGVSYVTSIDVWPFRPLTVDLVTCTTIPVDGSEASAQQVSGPQGTVYTLDRLQCDGTTRTIRAAGPIDRIQTAPEK